MIFPSLSAKLVCLLFPSRLKVLAKSSWGFTTETLVAIVVARIQIITSEVQLLINSNGNPPAAKRVEMINFSGPKRSYSSSGLMGFSSGGHVQGHCAPHPQLCRSQLAHPSILNPSGQTWGGPEQPVAIRRPWRPISEQRLGCSP